MEVLFWGLIFPLFSLWLLGKGLEKIGSSTEEKQEMEVELKSEEDIIREKEEKRLKRKRIREELEKEREKEKRQKEERRLKILENPVEIVKLDKPRNFNEFVSSSNTKKEILKKVKSAKEKNEPLRHMIYWGIPGTGKSTITELMADYLGVNLIEVAPKNLKEPIDLLNIFQKLSKNTSGQGDIILMDEIDMMKSQISELFNKALTDYQLVFTEENGRTIKSNLPIFTLVGTTNRLSKLLNSLKSRCELLHFEPYCTEDIKIIVQNLSNRYNIEISNKAVNLLANMSQNIPRNAVMLFKNARDFIKSNKMTKGTVKKVMNLKGIDRFGLNKIQRNYLKAIKNSSKGKLSLTNVASVLQVGRKTVQNDIEPYLKVENFIEVTSGGRILTEKGERIVS